MDKLESIQDLLDRVPHQRALGFRIVTFGPEEIIGFVPYDERLVGNPLTGVPHGGVVTTLLDTIGGIAVWARLERFLAMATLDLRIDYLRPSTPGADVYGRVECYKLTRNVAFTRGTAFNESPADPIAAMTATYMLNTASERRSPETPPDDADPR